MADIRADVIALSDYVYERTRGRLDGLTDTEYFWEPVPADLRLGCVGSSRAGWRAREPAAAARIRLAWARPLFGTAPSRTHTDSAL
jgi:hypothetical protein